MCTGAPSVVFASVRKDERLEEQHGAQHPEGEAHLQPFPVRLRIKHELHRRPVAPPVFVLAQGDLGVARAGEPEHSRLGALSDPRAPEVQVRLVVTLDVAQ
eukprot:CAMPEP_0182540070 /NCGR_PEP_ID=MMETSP1323-20130603/26478_1 /TAXON_ID=236787 /ORGANISM="Florenciella parvula, Strain RCC1693" /LENGTH=100 /DNA_ID=CAMNT_0024750691 /DNA_START=65 /DNA_END=367 /DNA_ORIENTATION=-